MSPEPALHLPLEVIYGILDTAKETFNSPAAAENMAMEYIEENCICGQVHKYEEVPEEIKVLAETTVKASADTVDLIRRSIEHYVIQGLEHGKSKPKS